MKYPIKLPILFTTILLFYTTFIYGQTYDTLSNWDGITQDWNVFGSTSTVVDNPYPDAVNTSSQCLKVITSTSPWDNISYEMPYHINLDSFPRYRVKVLAPIIGGTVTFKFQDENNSNWHEIEKTPVPGQWSDLEFDFSGLDYPNFTTLVIFYDFRGTIGGKAWYFDDVLKENPLPILTESNLPIIIINSFGNSIPDEPKVNAHMGIINNGPGSVNQITDPFNDYNGDIAIEIRGKSTQMFPKKSYGFETRDILGEDLKVPLLGMPIESDWILYAPYTDKSMLRNVITFEMAKQFEGYSSRTVFCELIVNSDYKGVYILMEKIKKDNNRVDINTLKPDEISGPDITGGYILAVDWRDYDFVYNVDGWKSNPVPAYPNAMDITFQFYYPKPEDIQPQQRTYIRNYVTNAENALTGTMFQNPETGYHKYFDVPSFVDFMLINEISKEVDKYRLSQYFFKEKDSDGGKLFAGPPWDFNLGYGNADYWAPAIDYTGWCYPRVSPDDYTIVFWWKRLMEDPYFKDLAKTRWVNLRTSGLTNSFIQSKIDSITALIDIPKDRNYQRWPILGTYVWPNYNWQNNDYEDEVDFFETFLYNRVNWIDDYLPGNILTPWVGISSEENKIKVTLAGDYFRNPLLLTEYFKLNNAPEGLTILSVQYRSASECILTLSASVNNYPQLSVTIDEKAINTWQSITSNKLETAGNDEQTAFRASVTLYNSNNQLIIRCTNPEILPNEAEIFNVNGQSMGRWSLEKSYQNIIPHNLNAGLYILNFQTSSGNQGFKFLEVKH